MLLMDLSFVNCFLNVSQLICEWFKPQLMIPQELCSLADKITDVATPSVSFVTASQLMTEVKQLRTEIIDFKQLVKAFTPYPSQRSQRTGHNLGRSPHLLIIVGATLALGMVPKSDNPLLLYRLGNGQASH